MKSRSNRSNSRRGGYIFTVREHPKKGIMSTILGAISILTIGAAVYLAYLNGGNAQPQYGAAVFIATLFSLTGIVLGIMSRIEKDRYYLFPHMGIGFNFAALCMVSMILYAGAYRI